MAKADFSLSFRVEADREIMSQVAHRLNRRLAGQIQDLVAQALEGLEFDLQEHHYLFSPEAEVKQPRPRDTWSIPTWSSTDQTFIEVKIGSAEWFKLIGDERKFLYRYEGVQFAVRFETRKSNGREYSYWRAYATVGGKLLTKQLGPTAALTKGSLDTAGAYFLGQRDK
jgi:hypothetical protein